MNTKSDKELMEEQWNKKPLADPCAMCSWSRDGNDIVKNHDQSKYFPDIPEFTA